MTQVNEIVVHESLQNEEDVGKIFPDGLSAFKGKTGNVENAMVLYTIRMHVSRLKTASKVQPNNVDKDLTHGPNEGEYFCH